MTVTFAVQRRPATTTPAERIAEIMRDPGFGKHLTDHMVTARFDAEHGWHDAELGPNEPLLLSPGASALHYGQAVFEGLKAFRQPDGGVAVFRPEANAARFRASARRLAMPELPEELFLASLRELVAADLGWVPEEPDKSLYLRPVMIATSVDFVVTPATEYLYAAIASPAGAYFGGGGVAAVSVWLSTDYVRAAPGGTGAAKCAGNYAGTLLAQSEAARHGCAQVVWVDAVERRWVEELGAMNLFFVFGSGADAEVVTPPLSGSLLPGVTRDSVLRLAADLGYRVTQRRISIQEWESAARSGELSEVFASGTAAAISPVGSVKHAEGGYSIGTGEPGPVTLRLRERLIAIQRGTAPDPYLWMRPLVG